MAITRLCDNCATPIIRSPAHMKRRRVFCSVDCRKQFHRPTVICPGCHGEFRRNPNRPKTYCSWNCFKASRWTIETCQVRGTDFESRLCETLKREERNHITCCSRSCRNVYTSLLLGGDGTWIEGGRYNPKRDRGYLWRKTRLQYLRLVGGRCEGCQGHPATEVHHLHPLALGGSLVDFYNLMAVCDDCHDNMHTQIREGAFWCSFEAALDAV